jgi:hypothetical protein
MCTLARILLCIRVTGDQPKYLKQVAQICKNVMNFDPETLGFWLFIVNVAAGERMPTPHLIIGTPFLPPGE